MRCIQFAFCSISRIFLLGFLFLVGQSKVKGELRRGVRLKLRKRKFSAEEMESTLKEMRNGDSVLDMNNSRAVGGGVKDIYGEDRATEDQLITPWSFSIAR